MFEGTHVAMVTDFKDGRLNIEGFRKLASVLVAGGVSGLVPAGCTGEAATLTAEERMSVIKAALEVKRGNPGISVIPGTGTNSTSGTIDLSRAAADLGVDGIMLITPYYNKPTQAGLVRHYEAVARAVNLPIVLYNVPGRTGVNMLPETTAELAEIDNIVAVKEASGSLDQVSRIAATSDITILSGDDSLTLPMMAVGAKGVVSVAANVAPVLVSRLVAACLAGKFDEAREIHMRLLPLFHVLFIETNPGPVKAALEMLEMGTGELRLPLVPAGEAGKRKVREVLDDLNLTGERLC
jgi:4-hydroxy-tetrahydrodipicolinate synthase